MNLSKTVLTALAVFVHVKHRGDMYARYTWQGVSVSLSDQRFSEEGRSHSSVTVFGCVILHMDPGNKSVPNGLRDRHMTQSESAPLFPCCGHPYLRQRLRALQSEQYA